jgi:Rrf2 family cysteine metabolism transcriptional repressor
MQVSQKCLYALRAIFELAKRKDEGPTKIADVAEAQAIPQRFLESILNQLKQAGFVESYRGSNPGYILIRSPDDLAVGEIIEFVEGPIGPTACLIGKSNFNECPLRSECIFMSMWEEIHNVISEVYNRTTIGDLVRRENEQAPPCIAKE